MIATKNMECKRNYMNNFDCWIARCRFVRASKECGRDIFMEPLTKQDLVSIERTLYLDSILSFVMLAAALGFGYFEMHGGEHVKSWTDLIPFILCVVLFFSAIYRIAGQLSKVLRKKQYRFDGVVMSDSANSFKLLGPADSNTRLRLAGYLRDSHILMGKIGAYLKIVNDQGRELTNLEAHFCCALCELLAVDMKLNDAERVLERAMSSN